MAIEMPGITVIQAKKMIKENFCRKRCAFKSRF
jgi:hypothetical protein